VPDRQEVVRVELFATPGTALPDESSSPAVSPVETKGYKNIVKLPDWLSARNISIKYDKPYQNGRIYHTDKWRGYDSLMFRGYWHLNSITGINSNRERSASMVSKDSGLSLQNGLSNITGS
jgi:hypothetical protein